MTTTSSTDRSARDRRLVLRLLYGFLLAFLVAAAVFAVRFVMAHTFTSFAATLLCLGAAWCVTGLLEEFRCGVRS